ncbi:hypothetical protein CSAL01_10689 [Colletotrichum salicis]|uniref:Uncharacterized protein n=1 Tax=Colletotrichum salicis TaxID=1209931 RepID=A0A135RXP5_9PEZI|nr:hypothetical protein CSAL01_10689 [Colletotrichum salicis]
MDAHAHAHAHPPTPPPPRGRHQNTPKGKIPPSLRTDICAHAHTSLTSLTSLPGILAPVPSPQFGPSLPFPNPRPLLFSSIAVSPPPSPPLHSRLPFPAAVILLSFSSAGDPLIATSNRPSPCPFVGPTDLQYCDCESSAFFARLHHSIASDPAAANNPPPVPSFPTALVTHLAFAYPLLATGRTAHTQQLSAAVFAQPLGVTASLINHSIVPANCRSKSDQRHRFQRRRCVIRSATLGVVDHPDPPTSKAPPKTPPSSQTRSPLTPESPRENFHNES